MPPHLPACPQTTLKTRRTCSNNSNVVLHHQTMPSTLNVNNTCTTYDTVSLPIPDKPIITREVHKAVINLACRLVKKLTMKITIELTQCNKVAAMKLGHNGEIKACWPSGIFVDVKLITTDCLYDPPIKLSLMFKIKKIHWRPLVRAPRLTFFLKRKKTNTQPYIESGRICLLEVFSTSVYLAYCLRNMLCDICELRSYNEEACGRITVCIYVLRTLKYGLSSNPARQNMS
jgi:hypothetical protein